MGDEVSRRFFEAEDFSRFRDRLDAETDLLADLFARGQFSRRGNVAGFELEAWLIDADGRPQPHNDRFLEQLNNPLVVPELARFNVELNGSPSVLTGRVFSRLHDELAATWAQCVQVADDLDCRLLTIGTLPSAGDEAFSAANMSPMIRYQSVNDRIMALRDGRPLQINIDGEEALELRHDDVMLEAAATSFQIHLQCKPETAVRNFNASLVSAAPLVAASANSPLLFGHQLWEESRIPLFEQAVDVGRLYPPRVSFGSGYVKESLLEVFEENRDDHLILLPWVQDKRPGQFAHLRFQNGTLWRWVRPLVGFDFDGQVHLRIEQRVVSAGPTLIDSIANSAFYYGMVRGFELADRPIESRVAFPDARQNFYLAARYGLDANVLWPKGDELVEWNLRELILDELLPLAETGLSSLSITDVDIERYLGTVEARVQSGLNGAAWQRRWRAEHGGPECDLQALVRAYAERQDTAEPVHTWSLD